MRLSRQLVQILFFITSLVMAGCGGSRDVETPPATAEPQPAATNFIKLQSEVGDDIGQGESFNYNQTNAVLTVVADPGRLQVRVAGDQFWFSEFLVPGEVAQLAPGTYSNMTWFGEGRGCSASAGTFFAIDQIDYTAGILTAIDLRFEQHCLGSVGALRGSIHWAASDTTHPAGPVNPPPAGLWQPPPGATPATGSFVYLQSDPGDFIGAGETYTYTPADTTFGTLVGDGFLRFIVGGAQSWSGEFQAMIGLSQLQPGFYAGLSRYPFHNPAKGGLAWTGEARACNTLKGWFVVDHVVYVEGNVTEFSARFEQHCEGLTVALRGQVHWSASDTAAPALH
jgi:hypothetical protein